MPVRIMSDAELTKFEILRDVDHDRMPVRAAAQVLGLTERQVWRLLKAYRLRGADGLISRKRGRSSNRKTPDDVRLAAMALVKERYADFGPTLAAEKLGELHDLHISRKTLRAWMVADGLWQTRRKRRGRVYQPRYRRDCLGELVQIDGSEHRWFEDRGPKCTLLVFIDDATSRLMHLQFAQTESTFSYFSAARTYFETHGKPIAFYSDKHSVFRVNRAAGATTDGMTQFGRALHELNIDILCANAPQAKGRVERAHKTLQDRLVKELRLAGANDIESGNALLPAFMAAYNRRFAKPARNDKDLHRPLAPHDDLDGSFAWRVERTVTNSLTVQYDRVMFILEPNEITRALPRKKVTVYDFPDGRIEVRHQGLALPYRTFDRITRVDQGAIVENKRLSEALELCRAMQAELPPKLRSKKAPARTAQAEHMFGVSQ
jgi:hypothetical protein